ncbi:MAG: VCBS repeat-containing protein [Nevskia sp.]|nr:VCBS repeat-containing protein [Nevskia sp.]
MRTRRMVLLAGWMFLLAAGAAEAAFPDTPPNDPGYANAGQYTLLGEIPRAVFPIASDPENAAGMSIDSTWFDTSLAATARAGDPRIVIAYLEGGINWNAGDASKDLVNKVYLNCGELPAPQDAKGATHPGNSPGCKEPDRLYDLNGDGVFNVQDYAHDPRVADKNGNGFLDPEDLIVVFSDGVDDDHDGYVDDISGWDFYNQQNDPATLDATYGHSDAQMGKAAAEADNGIGLVGACARCLILPVKVGAEALDRANELTQGLLFAADAGAKVITTENAALGYSSFEREAVEYLWRHDVLVAETSNDFDSTDHQGGMYWPHSVPGNGFVRDFNNTLINNLPPLRALTTTFRVRSGETSWGPKNLVTVETLGGSTSESTGTLGGVLGAVRSCALAYSPPGNPYTAPEILQVLIATASDADGAYVKWPNGPGWDLQTGYGRPNVHRACQAFAGGAIPPTAWFDAPEWFTLWDPTVTSQIPISGAVAAVRSPSYTWTLEYGLGGEPQTWNTLATGAGQTPYEGALGTLDLSQIPESFWQSAFSLSKNKELETTEQYAITLRLTVTDATGRQAEERRAIDVVHDPSWYPGFPVRVNGQGAMDGGFSPDGTSAPKLADLQGLGHLAIIYGDADGYVHALDPVTRQELSGWPVHTDPVSVLKSHPGVNPRYEPVAVPVAVGDLDHDGHLWVVAASTAGHVYAWDAQGRARQGFPQLVAKDVQPPPIPRPAQQFSRPPKEGAFSSPVLYDLDGDGTLEIVEAGWDGYVHVFQGDGTELKGFPVKVTIPDSLTPSGYVRIHDDKLDCAPVIADLDGDGKPEIVIRSQQSDTRGADIQPLGMVHFMAYHADGTPVSGWPVTLPSLILYYGSAQEFITEGSEGLAAADVDGDGRDEIAASTIFSPSYLLSGNGQIKTLLGVQPNLDPVALLSGRITLDDLLTQLPADVPVSFTTLGAFGRFGGLSGLAYAQAGSGAASTAAALLFIASGVQLKNFERIVDARTGVPLTPSAPFLQGLDFLSSPLFVDVSGDGQAEVVDAGDSNALHAYTLLGQAAGFPKFTSGWVVFSPSAGDLDGDGHTELVATTREGYVFVWKTAGTYAGNREWWSYHHDEWNTGRYGTDTRPPGALRAFTADATHRTLSFTAPGDDWYDGQPDHYRLVPDDASLKPVDLPAVVSAGVAETLTVPSGIAAGTVQAVDAAGNLGAPQHFAFGGGSSSGGSSGGGSSGSGSSGGSAGGSAGGGACDGLGLLALLGAAALRRKRVGRAPG